MKSKASSLLTLLLLLVVALATGQPARAQAPIALETLANGGTSLTYGGFTYTVSSCSFTNGSGRSQQCSTAHDDFYLAPDGISGTNANVIVEALNTGGSQVPIFSYTQGTSPTGTYDLSVTLSVVPTGTHTVSSAAATLSATAPSGVIAANPGDVHASETFAGNTGSVCGTGLQTNLGTLSQACTFTPQSTLSVSKDFGLTLSGISNGSTIALNSVVETFGHAPEPSSLSTLIPALLILGWAYRRKVLR